MPSLLDSSKPLQGLKVIITREVEKAKKLEEKLKEEGAYPILFPTIKTIPVIKPEYEEELKELSAYDWIIFTSANSVKYFFSIIEEFGLSFPSGEVKVAAIGSTTAFSLKKRGIEISLQPKKAVGESLVEAFSSLNLRGKKILFPRAKVARELVVEELRKMGAEVRLLIVYETVLCTDYLEEFLKEFKKGRVDIVTFTSASTAKNFYKLLEGKVSKEKLANLKAVCIGPITAQAVEKLGYKVAAAAKDYTTQGLVETLKELALNSFSCS